MLQELFKILLPAFLGGGFTWFFHFRKNLNKSAIDTTDQVVNTYEERVMKSMEILERLNDKFNQKEQQFTATQSELNKLKQEFSAMQSELINALQLLQTIADDCNCDDTHANSVREFLQRNATIS